MKKTIVVFGSSTGMCETIAQTIGAKLGVKVINVTDLTIEDINSADNLILGASTWGSVFIQEDWEDGLSILTASALQGKTVALFGCGDSSSYSDTFCAAIRILYDAVIDAGANVIGSVSTKGYTFDDSPSVINGRFVGLALDDVNEDDQTESRINKWLDNIKDQL